MSEIRVERKFRKYRGQRGYCDECGGEITADEWFYSRRDKYRVLRSRCSMFGVPLIRVIEETTLCKGCVPKDEILKNEGK